MTLLTLLRGGAAPPEPSWVTVTTPSRPSWDVALRSSHKLAVRATLLADGVPTVELPILGGSVTMDSSAATRARCDLQLADDGTLGLVPDAPTASLAPYGNEILIERGIEYADGGRELASLGVFRIDDVDVEDSGSDLTIQITGLDRSARLIDARFETSGAVPVAPAVSLEGVIVMLVQQAYPDVVFDIGLGGDMRRPAAWEEAADRWAYCQDIARSLGKELYFDSDGTLVLRPITIAGSGTPIATFSEGVDGVLLSAGRRWSREGTYNRWIVTGESTDPNVPPARGEAIDNNPLSPTYYYGRFGKVPGWYSSPFVTTDAQAADAAQGMLARQLGATQQVSFGTLVDPRRRPGDIVRITRARTGIDEDHVIDSLTIPLTADGVMSGSTRATQVYS